MLTTIQCDEQWLRSICERSGRSWEECRQCIVSASGPMVQANPSHPSFPRPKAAEPSGPGTELKKLLQRFGIKASPTCSCNAKATEMDRRGVEWCEANIPEIVSWLRQEAGKRKLPFADFVGRALVKLAIAKAKRGTGK